MGSLKISPRVARSRGSRRGGAEEGEKEGRRRGEGGEKEGRRRGEGGDTMDQMRSDGVSLSPLKRDSPKTKNKNTARKLVKKLVRRTR